MSTKKQPQGTAYAYMQFKARGTSRPTLTNNSYKFKGHISMPVTTFTGGTTTFTISQESIKS